MAAHPPELLKNGFQRFLKFAFLVFFLNTLGALFWSPKILWSLLVCAPILIIGTVDCLQTQSTIRRNFPFLGNFRFLLEQLGPELHQYFIESDHSGRPFNRDQRSVVYQRAKNQEDTRPFGTQLDVYETGYEWVNHSLSPVSKSDVDSRILIGGPHCSQPYSASIFNISAMSYGSLSKEAISSLNGGAQKGGFAQNTGEGGVSPAHLKFGGDLIWQIGTGYFGCRSESGGFDPEKFAQTAALPSVKMIEVKLSQGAKPGHGGMLPGEKVTEEVAQIRGIPVGQEVLSPGKHTAFSTPIEFCHFLQQLRELSQGKPIGFKICIGIREEFLAIAKACVETGLLPDFISVDGAEGGTGAAPMEFAHRIGCPLTEALQFVHSTLVGFQVREHIRVIASGRIISGFDLISKLCIGADAGSSARGMMFSLGCIQALKCNQNSCPVGVATQDPNLRRGLVVEDKKERVYNYHKKTVKAAQEMMAAMGITHADALKPWHLMRRVDGTNVRHYQELFDYLEPGCLLDEGSTPPSYLNALKRSSSQSFTPQELS